MESSFKKLHCPDGASWYIYILLQTSSIAVKKKCLPWKPFFKEFHSYIEVTQKKFASSTSAFENSLMLPADTFLGGWIIKICFGYYFYKFPFIYIAQMEPIVKKIALLHQGLHKKKFHCSTRVFFLKMHCSAGVFLKRFSLLCRAIFFKNCIAPLELSKKNCTALLGSL